MSKQEKIDQDIVQAVKSKDELTVSVLRMLKSAIKNAEIDKGEKLKESETINVLEKQAKQHKDSIEQYQRGGRKDLVDKEKAELSIIEKYLPEKMSEEELEKLTEQVILDLGASSIEKTGQVIKEVITRSQGRADGQKTSDIVREKLR
jgi:uncharacterized protein YqeY